jgi:hypothetical protein
MPVGKKIKDEDEDSGVIDPSLRNPNYIRDLLFVSLSLAEATAKEKEYVPPLFMGNPGIAKTTGVRLWAEINKYRVTTLIGTQRVAEEILGYMVNDLGEKKLVTYTPDWFDEIQENSKDGFKTLLFVDELSQAPDNVQGAMLQLIFDRRVGGRSNFLPDDCLVVAAANYKGNIPAQCGLQAPTLNRFSIINVEPQDGVGLVTEFLQTEEERRANLPAFTYTEISPTISESILKNLKSAMLNLVSLYAKDDEQDATLDFKNQNYADIFDRPGPLYNFITGRTIAYLYREMKAMVYLGIIRKEYKAVVVNVFLGLAGLGTNTFKDPENKVDGDFNQYKIKLISRLQGAVRRAVEDNLNEINATEINYKGITVEKSISKWLMYADTQGGVIYDKNLKNLMVVIKDAYPTDVVGMEAVITKWDNSKMLNDLQKITTLHNSLKAYQMIELESNIKDLAFIKESYEGYLTVARDEIV